MNQGVRGAQAPRRRGLALLACGALAIDVRELVQSHGWDADVHGISSELHMIPLEIAPAVEAKLSRLVQGYERVIVVYADCGTGGRLDAVLERYPDVVRPAGVHCFGWYSGALESRLVGEPGIYVLTDWLVENWDRAVVHGLGLDRFPWLRDEYFRHITRVLFVRQRPDAEGEQKARTIAAWLDRPLEVHDAGLGPLDDLLTPLIEREATDVRT